MLGIDWRAARISWTVFLFALLILIIYSVRETLLLFTAAFLLAYMLSPLLDFIARLTPPHVSRTASLAVVYVLLITVVTALISWLGGQVAEQAVSLARRLPELVEKHKDLSTIPLPAWLEPARARVAEVIRTQLEGSSERILPFLQHAIGKMLGYAGNVIFLVIVPILAFFFLKDGRELRLNLLSLAKPANRPVMEGMLDSIHSMLIQYIRALLILSAATSVSYLLFFSVIDLPYALLVSALAAPLEFIPIFGPLTASAIILLIAAFTGFPHIWWILVFLIAYRLFQDYVLQPYLLSSGIELHPLLVLFGALAGERLGGVWGMFLSVPILAVLRIIFAQLKRSTRVETLSS